MSAPSSAAPTTLRSRGAGLLHHLTIGRLLALALLVRLISIPIIHNSAHPDSWEFGVIAYELSHGHGYSYYTYQARIPSAFMPPGYTLVLAAAFRVLGLGQAPWIFLNLIQAGLGTVLVLLVYRLSLQLYRRELLARLAALFAALYPPLVYMCNEYHSINFYIVLSTGAVLYLDRACQPPYQLSKIIKAALFMGPLLLFRAEALALLLIYAAILLTHPFRNRFRYAVTYTAISLLFLLPWIVRNEMVFHRFIPTTTSLGLNLWIGNNPNSSGSDRGGSLELSPDLLARFQALPPDANNEVVRNQALVQASTAYMRTHPARELRLAVHKLYDLLVLDPLHPKGRKPAYWVPSILMSCLALLHIFIGPRISVRRLIPILVNIALALALAVIFFALPRYKIVLDPFLCIFAAATLQGLVRASDSPELPARALALR